MATKKAKDASDDLPDLSGDAPEIDQAVDDLRGILKADAEGGLPDLGGDFGSDFPGDSDGAPGFGGDFGAEFGGGAMDTSFGGGAAFGGSADYSSSSREPGSALNANLDLIMDIPIEVQIVLGTSKMQVAGLMNLTEGATIALDRKIGEPVDIIVNGRLIGRGEITVLENDETRFGVKLTEVKSTKKA